MPKLTITSLSKTFGAGNRAVTALQGVDLAIGDNEFLSLVGTSGCGKSTLLSIVAGLESHDEGEVLVDGVPVDGPGLDRPRHYDMVATPRFQQLHRAVLDSIRAESIAVAQLGAALG